MSEINLDEHSICEMFDISSMIPDFHINGARRDELSFQENLIVLLKDQNEKRTKPVGGYSISLESIGPQNLEFLVHVVSSMKVERFFGGTKVIGSINEKLHCLEEKRNEFIQKEEVREEKILYIGAQDDSYYMETTNIIGFQKNTSKNELKFCKNRNFLSETANILLMRYLSLTNFQGNLQFGAITIDGEIAFCNYKCLPAQKMLFHDSCREIYTIERTIHKEFCHEQKVLTLMDRRGRILRHDWLEIPYKLEINPLIDLDKMEYGKMPEKISLRDSWTEDMELLSLFLDQKNCRVAQKTKYLEDHPEVKDMIADYVQAVLLVKPVDLLSFTIQHFMAFADKTKTKELSAIPAQSGEEITKLFRNFGMKLAERDSKKENSKSQESVQILNLKVPEYSICSSSSSEIYQNTYFYTQESSDQEGKCNFRDLTTSSSCENCNGFCLGRTIESGGYHSELIDSLDESKEGKHNESETNGEDKVKREEKCSLCNRSSDWSCEACSEIFKSQISDSSFHN